MAKRFTPLRLQIPKGAAYFVAIQQIAKGFGPPMGSGSVLVAHIPKNPRDFDPHPNAQTVNVLAPLGLSTGDVAYLRGAQAGLCALARLVQPVRLTPTGYTISTGSTMPTGIHTDPATPKG